MLIGELIDKALGRSSVKRLKTRHTLLKCGDTVEVNGRKGRVIRIYESSALIDFGGGVKYDVDKERL